MKEVLIKLPKDLTGIAGYPYGKKIFEEQVAKNIDLIDLNEKIIIKFPDHIERVASSFVQGFFSYIMDHVEYDEFSKMIVIEAKTEELAEDIRGNIR